MSVKRPNWPTLISVAALALALLQFLFGDNLVERIPAPLAETILRLAWQVGPAVALLGVVAYVLTRMRRLAMAREETETKLAQEQAAVTDLQMRLTGTAADLAKVTSQFEALRQSVEDQEQAERDRRMVPDVPHNPPGGLLDFDVGSDALGRLYLVALDAVQDDAPDAALEYMAIMFEPYIKSGAPLRWAYSFFSPALRRSYYYSCFPGSPVEQVSPSTAEPASTLLGELPWVACPGWLNTLREACNQVGPLAQAEQTGCRVLVSAAADGQPHWTADFKDGATGHSFKFEWTSPGDLRLVHSTKG